MRFKKQPRKYTREITRRIFCEDLENRLLLSNNPSATTVTPASGATNVALNAPVEVDLNLPNGGINPTTVTESTFYLYQTAFPGDNAKFVTASVKTTGGGDALLLTPLGNLLPSTSYTLVISSGVQDVNGDTFTPYTEAFTTGSTVPQPSQNFAFTQSALPTTNGYEITDMQVGPDGLMYASTETGQILRFPINSDGSLGTPQVITSLQTANGGNQLITGFAFDPSFIANPSAPMLWVSDTYYALSGATNAPNFTSKLTVMSGANLQNVTDAIIDLPRSVADHVNDQPIFQPGTDNLFFCEAGENAYGAPDTTWGNRPETELSAAILEVNTSLLNLSGPALNVLTPDATNSMGVSLGGTYNPNLAGAPLTIYATGIRNAFSLIFDNTGQLWAPSNGSSSGGNSPAGPGNVPPALTNIQQVEEDTLIKVQKNAYYGHPDPVRSQYVLGQGNPSTGAVPGLAFTAYPSGTNPDPNYQLPNYVFGLHVSPDGIIEYEGSAFGGALNGDFLVTEYSAPDNVVVLARDSNNNIVGGLDSSATSPLPDYAVSGFQDLNDPLAITEDPTTGYIYVSQIGADGGLGNAVVLKPSSVTQQITPSATLLTFNTIATGKTGAGPSPTETVTITNTGADSLNFSSIGIVNATGSSYASNFSILNSSSEPTTLSSVGMSFTFQIQFTASTVGLEQAALQIKSNDPATPTLSINLSGIGTSGLYLANEPSLVQVLQAFDIPTIVGAGLNDVNVNTENYPENPDPSSQEVTMQQMVAATSNPVVITPLASFSANNSPVSDIGYYTPGSPNATTQLLSIPQADAQTVNLSALGTFSFNPGNSAFGLYGYFPGISAADYHYSQDTLNTTLDPVNTRKIRFFPYEMANGTIVPNTYIFAIEDNNTTTYNSFDNFVGIISNVTGAVVPPTNLAVASNTSSAVVLTWTAAAGATSYTIAREGPGASTFTPIATGLTTPTYTDLAFMAGQTYQYEVQSVNVLNSSPFTAPISVTPPTTGLIAPANLQVGSATVNGVVLTWNVVTGATSYIVQREGPGQSSYSQLASNLTSPTYTDTTVAAANSYSYQIIAVYPTGDSHPSLVVTAAIPVPPETLSINVSKGTFSFVQFTTPASAVVTIKLNGAGAGMATVNFTATTISQSATGKGIVISGTNVSIASITTTGTTPASSLAITTKGGNNAVSIGAISADAALNSIIAPTTALIGNLSVNGSINRITLGSVAAVTMTIGGKLGVFQAASVTGVTLTAGGMIGTITAASWSSNQAVTAASINSITLKGNAQLDVAAGVLRSLRVQGALQNSKITLSAAGAQDLANLSAFSINNTVLDAAGNIGTISASMLTDSQIYAGTGASAATAFPPVGTSFPAAATIANVNLKKVNGVFSDTGSSIAASRISHLSLGNIQFSNAGTPFGVQAVSIGLLSAANPAVKPFIFHNLTSQAIVSAEFAAKNITSQDFEIGII